ncbi:MAG: transglycosylase SLT domain-containing protein [Proteobacteria bacterium]|nr:transglycosylase SLT domain-containing protein [Pseudomonadota bacterium]
MRKIILIATLSFFSGCQTNKIKVVSEPLKPDIDVLALIDEIEQCRNSEECNNELDSYLTSLNVDIESEFSDHEPEDHDSEVLSTYLQQSVVPASTLNPSPLLDNKRVQAALNEWLTWKRPKLIETWNNYQYLKNRVYTPFEQQNIPEALLLGLIAQESGGRVHSISSAGASGLFQLMPATANRFGVKGMIGDYDARYHPETAAKGAAKYIQEQKGHYGNNYSKILAAYNAGENRFRRLNKKHNNKEVWDNQFFYDLPTETQSYISKVLSAMLIFESPLDYNVTLDSSNGSTALIRVLHDTSLSELAVCFGQFNNKMGWYRILRNLNSSINAKRTIKQNSVVVIPTQLKEIYQSKCQTGELMAMAKKIHLSDFPDRPGYTLYRIKQGDSLSTIGRKFKCTSRKEIARINKIKAPRYLINAGKKLKIPKC